MVAIVEKSPLVAISCESDAVPVPIDPKFPHVLRSLHLLEAESVI